MYASYIQALRLPLPIHHVRPQVKTAVLQGSIYTCSGGVTSIADVSTESSGRGPALIVGGGDGSLTVFTGYGKVLSRSLQFMCSRLSLLSTSPVVRVPTCRTSWITVVGGSRGPSGRYPPVRILVHYVIHLSLFLFSMPPPSLYPHSLRSFAGAVGHSTRGGVACPCVHRRW